MKRKNKSLLTKAFSVICDAENLPDARSGLKRILSDRADLTAKEKNALFKEFIRLYNLHDYGYLSNSNTVKETMHLMSTIERRSDSRNKTENLKDMMRGNRATTGLPIIFYLSSYHEKPAKGHKDYQGMIFVDRFWRNSLDSHPELSWLENPIRAYIRNHDVLTVQEVTSGEPYLITRPYCKHFLVPLNTWDVLTSSLSAIKREHPEAIQGTGNKSRRQYRREYLKNRNNLQKLIKEKTSVSVH